MGESIHYRGMGDLRDGGDILDSRLPTDPETMVGVDDESGTGQRPGQGKEIDAMGSSYKLWNKRLDGDTLTRGQILQFCHAIAAGYHGYYIGGKATNLTPEECRKLGDKVRARAQADGGYKLTPDHTKFGIEWLRKDPDRAESVGVTRPMLDTFQEFRFVGWRVAHVNAYATRATITPVYRVVTGNGIVDYSWSPWQGKVYA